MVAGCRLPVAGCRLPVAGCRLPVASCQLPVVRVVALLSALIFLMVLLLHGEGGFVKVRTKTNEENKTTNLTSNEVATTTRTNSEYSLFCS
jgi:hypothetical protein